MSRPHAIASGLGASTHARERARTRYGVELTEEQWHELACSIAAGEHRYLGAQAGGCAKYLVLLARDDGSVVRLPLIVAPGGTIVTCPPPWKGEPQPPPREGARYHRGKKRRSPGRRGNAPWP